MWERCHRHDDGQDTKTGAGRGHLRLDLQKFKTPLECLLINGVRFINKWAEDYWAELMLKIMNGRFQWPPWGEVGWGI